MATPTYNPIASTTLSSSASSVTFSSLDTIAAGYRDLVLVIECKTTANNDRPGVVFNNNGNGYNTVGAEGNGSSTSSYFTDSTDVFNRNPYFRLSENFQTGSSDTYSAIVQILDFTATDKHKPVLIRANSTNSSAPGTGMVAGRWASTSAVTRIDVKFSSTGLYAAGSTFSLYGIVA